MYSQTLERPRFLVMVGSSRGLVVWAASVDEVISSSGKSLQQSTMYLCYLKNFDASMEPSKRKHAAEKGFGTWVVTFQESIHSKLINLIRLVTLMKSRNQMCALRLTVWQDGASQYGT